MLCSPGGSSPMRAGSCVSRQTVVGHSRWTDQRSWVRSASPWPLVCRPTWRVPLSADSSSDPIRRTYAPDISESSEAGIDVDSSRFIFERCGELLRIVTMAQTVGQPLDELLTAAVHQWSPRGPDPLR